MTTARNTLSAPLLRVENLSVGYGKRTVVHNVSFVLKRGRALALIGQSGSGKSTIGRAVLRLLPPNGEVKDGRVLLEEQDLLTLSERSFREIRGREIGFVPQDPQNSLNRVRTIGAQAYEASRLLPGLTKTEQLEQIRKTFIQVGLQAPDRILSSFPHELSGGQLQRVLIGLAILPRPKILVADEPTSALDVTIQRTILDLLSELKSTLNIGVVLITHDLAVAAERAEDVLVLKDGRVQELGPSEQVFAHPASEYTRGLQRDVPALNPNRFKSVYRPSAHTEHESPALEVKDVVKSFNTSGSVVQAVKGVSFSVQEGSTHALVGESGSGKTTLVRILLGLETEDSGTVRVDGKPLPTGDAGALRRTWRNLQLVYQNPFTSLDPTWTVARIVAEPLRHFKVGNKVQREERVHELIGQVGLSSDLLKRRATELSGGQRQRVAIARALALNARILVLDEPTSALDVTVQAEIVEVLFELQRVLNLTYLFVSHDLSLIRQVADTVSVLKNGSLVESGNVEDIFLRPKHDYTMRLVSSIPGRGNAVKPEIEQVGISGLTVNREAVLAAD